MKDRFNTRRLLEPIGYVLPAEYETRYYEQTGSVTHIIRSPEIPVRFITLNRLIRPARECAS